MIYLKRFSQTAVSVGNLDDPFAVWIRLLCDVYVDFFLWEQPPQAGHLGVWACLSEKQRKELIHEVTCYTHTHTNSSTTLSYGVSIFGIILISAHDFFHCKNGVRNIVALNQGSMVCLIRDVPMVWLTLPMVAPARVYIFKLLNWQQYLW